MAQEISAWSLCHRTWGWAAPEERGWVSSVRRQDPNQGGGKRMDKLGWRWVWRGLALHSNAQPPGFFVQRESSSERVGLHLPEDSPPRSRGAKPCRYTQERTPSHTLALRRRKSLWLFSLIQAFHSLGLQFSFAFCKLCPSNWTDFVFPLISELLLDSWPVENATNLTGPKVQTPLHT